MRNLLETIGHIFVPGIKPADTDWHCHESLASGPMMQRRSGGKLETREMTEAETDDYLRSRCGW